MMESRRASPEIDQIRARTAESIGRSIALILDRIERRQDARDTALCLALCPKAACRRTRRCREFSAHERT